VNIINAYKSLSASELAHFDALFADRQHEWWNSFYANRAKPIPFFGTAPDENLHEWLENGTIARGAALDIGCGNGRNAIFLAKSGFTVYAVDYLQSAIEWAGQRADEAGVDICLHHASIFEMNFPPGGYDFVYDYGCFHHIAPHRRAGYVSRIFSALKPGGWFGVVCFRPEGGSGFSDEEVYERRSLGGGLGYSEERLREIWNDAFAIHTLRQMKQQQADSGLFCETFLWAMLTQRCIPKIIKVAFGA
jgi:cyclopropane fatty-acyl-phospholipid synthase-like methyltransferase